jgi:hypothetical protein
MWGTLEAASRRLLRVLFVWLGTLSAKASCRSLLWPEVKPLRQRALDAMAILDHCAGMSGRNQICGICREIIR